MKKLLSVFLALVMVFALCGGALAAEGTVDTDAPTDTTGETPTDPATDEAPAEPEGVYGFSPAWKPTSWILMGI